MNALTNLLPRSGVVVKAQTDGSIRKGRRIRGAILIAIVVLGVVIWKAEAIPADSHADAVKRRVSSAVPALPCSRRAMPQ